MAEQGPSSGSALDEHWKNKHAGEAQRRDKLQRVLAEFIKEQEAELASQLDKIKDHEKQLDKDIFPGESAHPLTWIKAHAYYRRVQEDFLLEQYSFLEEQKSFLTKLKILTKQK